jgi:hypothetical protein
VRAHWLLGLLLFFAGLPVLAQQEQHEAPASPLAATFDVQPLESTGLEQDGSSLLMDGWQGSLTSEVFSPGWEFMAVGATWANELPEEATFLLDIRVSGDGEQWSNWFPLPDAEDDGPDGFSRTATDLLFVEGEHLQLRALLQNRGEEPVVLENLRVTVIDGRPGPTAQELAAQVAATTTDPPVISRAAWGANESYRFDSKGNELWPRRYHTLRALFVHHTASPVSNPDPAAAVRSVYYYHAVTRGWGDIGYHYVVDQFGNIYQGRFGTEQNGLVVEGGHASGYNRNTMGVSLIGDFTRTGPPAAQMNGLNAILASRAGRYGINPYAPVNLDGTNFGYSLVGHRDSDRSNTTCPGQMLYNQMPAIRSYVASAIVNPPPPPPPPPPSPTPLPPLIVTWVGPPDHSVVEGIVTLQATSSRPVERMEYFLDNSMVGASTNPPWQVQIDARSLPAGTFRLSATGVAGSERASDERTVTVPRMWNFDGSGGPISPIMSGRLSFFPSIGRNVVAAAGPVAPAARMRVHSYLPAIPTTKSCELLVKNSAFNSNEDWVLLLGDYAARFADEHHVSPPRSLRAGMAPGDNQKAWSSARLPLTLPSRAHSVKLTLRYLPQSNGVGDGYDLQYIGILDAAGTYIASVVPTALRDEDTWQSATYDLQPYLGQTIFLYVGARNDGVGNSTRIYVDDIQVTLCP